MSVDLETKLSSCNFSQKTDERICFSILMTWKYLKLEVRFHASSTSELSGQKNKFVRLFFGRRYRSTILVLRSTDLKTPDSRVSWKLQKSNTESKLIKVCRSLKQIGVFIGSPIIVQKCCFSLIFNYVLISVQRSIFVT